jgi:16S rRNA processing protein RimM
MTNTAAQDSGDPTPQASSWVEVGRVLRAHGLSGALLVGLHSDDAANLLAAPQVLLEGSARKCAFELTRAERRPSAASAARARLWLRGLADRDAAQAWAGARISIPEAALAVLPEGEFYWRDLIGARVCRADGRALGEIAEIWPTPAHDVLVVRDGERTRLLPARQDAFVRFDRDARTLVVDFDVEDEEGA